MATDNIARAMAARAQHAVEKVNNLAALNTAYKNMVDGTNTTNLFWSYYLAAQRAGKKNRYKILCRFADIIAAAWGDKTYTLQYYDASVSGNTKMTPMDDLAGKAAAQLCTENTEAIEDWADEDPMTWYIRANALSLEDGTMNITYFEGEDGFDITGEDSPVYTFALALWIKEWNDEKYNYISFRTAPADEYHPDAGDVGVDNEKRPITWHATFPGGLDSKGALTSGAGIKPYLFVPATTGIQKARQKTAYEGLWNDCDTKWILRMWQLRHFDMENSNIAEGCVSYNFQYTVAVTETDVKRVLLTTTQAANIIVGSTVSVGEMGTNTNKDRGNAYMRNLANLTRVLSIETVTIRDTQYAAVNLDIAGTITTTTTTCVSTMPWYSGNTEKLPGRKDGCTVSLTAGKTPLRIAGVEVLDGAYVTGLDPLYRVTTNPAGGYDYAMFECADSRKLSGSITTDYTDTGLKYVGMPSGWNYVRAFAQTERSVLFATSIGGSSTTYFKSAFFGTSSAGVRCPWRFGSLTAGVYGGLACGYGYYAPSLAVWSGRPRLCGAGKMRGELPM